MMINATHINAKYKYSICTLITNEDEYQVMLDSFRKKGFNDTNTEFIYIDNISMNTFDAYSGINHMLNISTGQYIILCHQDVVIRYDDESILFERLLQLDKKDKNWALAGNAGGIDLRHTAAIITDPNGTIIRGRFPQRVKSLDENFIIVNQCNRIAASGDLTGFHLYGADLCLIADILGYSSYVIDFHLLHKSKGDINQSFFDCKKSLIQKYNRSLRSRYIRTTCTRFFLSKSRFYSSLFNKKRILNIISSLRLGS